MPTFVCVCVCVWINIEPEIVTLTSCISNSRALTVYIQVFVFYVSAVSWKFWKRIVSSDWVSFTWNYLARNLNVWKHLQIMRYKFKPIREPKNSALRPLSINEIIWRSLDKQQELELSNISTNGVVGKI